MEGIFGDNKFKDQLSGTVVNTINQNRIEEEILKLGIQDKNFGRAVGELEMVRSFVGLPQNILGNYSTKHGEIAERVEVGVRRAHQALVGHKMTATFDGVGRCAPEDYIIDGISVQSKFISSTQRNLDSVLDHMSKYSNFGRDGSYYHIPKNEYEIIEKILNDEKYAGDLRLRTIETIKDKIAQIECLSGKSFEEVVKPGLSTYKEVQIGKVDQTLNNHHETISKKNDQIKQQIKEDHQPNYGEAVKAAGIAFVVGAGVSLTTSLYKKYKDGKKFYSGDFTSEDWKEVGIDTGKGGALGAISGGAIYGLTNYAKLSAPFAAAVVSASYGVGSLVKDLNNGEIDKEEFVELGMVLCAESAIVGFATVAGQAAIPIPVVGAVLGSVAGTMFKNALGSGDNTTAKSIQKEIDEYLHKLDKKYKILAEKLIADFKKLGELTEAAFDINNNLTALNLSVDLGIAYGVKEKNLLKSTNEIDFFMTQ